MTSLLGRLIADARVRAVGPQRVADSIRPAIAALPVPGRCQFDAEGWLRGPIQITHLTTPNHSGAGFGTGRGVVIHTEAGYEAGTVATFMNPANQVSAFWSIARGGTCHQYVPVGHGYCAWSQAAGNDAWRGVEDEDQTHPSIPLTAKQIATFGQILEACSTYDGFPLEITDDVNGTGLITHGDGGVNWGNHPSCPGSVRRAQRPQIIAMAKAIRTGTATPSAEYVTDGRVSWVEIAAEHKITAAYLLRLNGGPGQPFPEDMRAYINDGNLKAPMPAKITVRVPG